MVTSSQRGSSPAITKPSRFFSKELEDIAAEDSSCHLSALASTITTTTLGSSKSRIPLTRRCCSTLADNHAMSSTAAPVASHCVLHNMNITARVSMLQTIFFNLQRKATGSNKKMEVTNDNQTLLIIHTNAFLLQTTDTGP
jgi:hypothetical protein